MAEKERIYWIEHDWRMIVAHYASKFTKLLRFVPKFVASKMMKMRRFDEELAFCIRNQLAV